MLCFSKKTILLALLIAVISLTSIVYADISDEAGGIIDGFNNAGSSASTLETPVAKILGLIKYIGVAVALGMIIVIGIKWMTAGAGGKATVKDTLLPYLIGAICVGAFGAIAEFAINLGQDNGGNVTTSTSTSTSTKQNTNTVLCGCSTCNGNQKKYSSSSCGCALCQVGACKCSSCK